MCLCVGKKFINWSVFSNCWQGSECKMGMRVWVCLFVVDSKKWKGTSTWKEFMRRICKTQWVITSQVIKVKQCWENTTAFSPSKPHEKDSNIRTLSAADQKKPLWNQMRKMSPAEDMKQKVPCVGLVITKNILSMLPLSHSITAEGIFEKIWHRWRSNGEVTIGSQR